jgi:hypothetical protein
MKNRGLVMIHAYTDDGARDLFGDGRCATCGLPKKNRSHNVPQRSDEEREAEMRRMGETE